MEAVAVDLGGVALVQIACGIGAGGERSLDAGCPTYRWFCGHLSSCCGSERFRPEALVNRLSAARGRGTTLDRGDRRGQSSEPSGSEAPKPELRTSSWLGSASPGPAPSTSRMGSTGSCSFGPAA